MNVLSNEDPKVGVRLPWTRKLEGVRFKEWSEGNIWNPLPQETDSKIPQLDSRIPSSGMFPWYFLTLI